MDIHILRQAAQEAIILLGGKSDNWLAIATHFVQEKGWTWWQNPAYPYNVGNVTHEGVQSGFCEYPTLYLGVVGYVNNLLHTSFDHGETLVYQNVLDAIRNGSNDDVLMALHHSPFCDPPYPLEELEGVYKEVEAFALPYEDQHANKLSEINTLKEQISQLEKQIELKQTELMDLESAHKVEYVTVTLTAPHNTLWNIAQDVYGSGNLWPDLLRLNPAVNVGHLREGQQIRVK